jgi:hypothetical protein
MARHSEQDNEFKQECDSDVLPIQLAITVTVNITSHGEKKLVVFSCNYDKCNNPVILSEIQNVIDQNFDLTPIRVALGYGNQSKTASTTTKTSHSSTSEEMATASNTTAGLTMEKPNNQSPQNGLGCAMMVAIFCIAMTLLTFNRL